MAPYVRILRADVARLAERAAQHFEDEAARLYNEFIVGLTQRDRRGFLNRKLPDWTVERAEAWFKVAWDEYPMAIPSKLYGARARARRCVEIGQMAERSEVIDILLPESDYDLLRPFGSRP